MSRVLYLVALLGCILQVRQALEIPPFEPIPSPEDLDIPQWAKDLLEKARAKINEIGVVVHDKLQNVVDKFEESINAIVADGSVAIDAATAAVKSQIEKASESKPECAIGASDKLDALKNEAASGITSCVADKEGEISVAVDGVIEDYQEAVELVKNSMKSIKECTSGKSVLAKGSCVAKAVTELGKETYKVAVSVGPKLSETSSLILSLQKGVSTCVTAQVSQSQQALEALGTEVDKCVG